MEITKTVEKKDLPYISVKPCPICGEHPQRVEESLARPGGGGYPGYFTYEYKCEYCKLLKGGEATDLYISSDEARNLAKELWNDKVATVQGYLDYRKAKEQNYDS